MVLTPSGRYLIIWCTSNALSWVLQTCRQSETTVMMCTTEYREEGGYDTDLSKSQPCFSQITQHSDSTRQRA